MRFGFGAVVLVVILGAGQAAADYLRIKVDLKHATPNPQTATVQGPGQMPGGMPFPGPGGFKGGKGAGGFRPPITGNVPPSNDPNMPPPGPSMSEDHLWVTVYLEIKGKPEPRGSINSPWYLVQLDHQFGKNALIPILRPSPEIAPPFLQTEQIPREPLAREHERKLTRLKESSNAKGLIELAFWDWSHGLMKEFHATMDELGRLDAKNPAAVAYRQIQKQLKAPLADDDPTTKSYLDETRSQGFRTVISDKGHYALLSNLPPVPANDVQIKRRLTRLEEAMESFYYWFALQEKVAIPPMPRYRLVGILINDANDFNTQHAQWGSVPMLADGFTPRRDNIMILCAKHRDEAYVILDNKTQSWMQTIQAHPEELLNGDIWNPKKRVQASAPLILPNAIIQTMVIVQKAMEDEAERATLSHEAIRQLLAASGLLPRNIAAPEWIQEGLAAYFERPFGAVYGAGGLPSWSNLVAFKDHKARDLGQGRDILLDVITDRYFQMARRASTEVEDGRSKLTDKVRDEWERARATSWALVYFLIKEQKLDRLLSYVKEISEMPRDLEFDQQTLETTFARSFGLSGAKDGTTWDPSRLQAFADSWIEDMKTISLELPAVEVDSMKTRKSNAAPASKKDGPLPKGPAGQPPPPPPAP